ncbi:serine/threonine-protein kinase OSR1 isoform X2 [Cinnamomum micranthum f. kanehirae]|uniref:Serine/threonine-protein kinase OSR1 isoform X2 n=1 Tax=Cinnamomum micranthum f. kanehirae TaxID=337451 RepID=A0A443PKN8_9MAGN|nr:serine/threonine-protein kinase OSR1 isoform X2 [Cinnamomum micranthum f. kanehirae]
MQSHLESPRELGSSSKMKRLNSEKSLGECAEKKKYPISAQDYELIEEIGQGVSASVHRALCIPFNEVVAIKILDFERNNSDLSNICREAQTMILVDHPNVLKAHCSFVNDHSLWVVMPYMAGGSCLHILKAAFPDGFEEVIIATVLREVLRGLEYLHHHGHIHRDVKAGNILVDSRGAIKLGDFGVSACLFDSGDRQRSRNTFVGTPCWMAPEVMEQLHGYDFKADIWSFGITALELAHGHAPFSKYPPMKVLLMTLQNAPPGLDYERDKKFSKSFKQMIAMCLVKDPSKRPSAQKLLKHTFFKQARSSDYISRKILEGLPTLGDRLKALKLKEADMLAQKKMPDGEKEEISQNEYKRGISGWNFNIEDVKTQASLIQDIDDAEKDQGCCSNSFLGMDSMQERQSQWVPSNMTNSLREKEDDDVMKYKASPLPLSERSLNHTNGSEDEHSAGGSTCEQDILQNGFLSHDNVNKIDLNESGAPGTYEKNLDCTTTRSFHESGVSMGPDATDNGVSPLKGESEKHQNQLQNIGNCSVPVVSLVVDDTSSENLPKVSKLAASNGDESDEKGKVPVVQQKGRFKVTSESVGLEKSLPTPLLQKSHSMQVIIQHPSISLPSSPGDATMNQGSSLFSQLHYILQTNIIQRDNILNLMKQLSTGDISANNSSNGGCIQIPATITEKSLLEAAHEREKELIQDINDLQLRLLCAQEELQRLKTKNAQV